MPAAPTTVLFDADGVVQQTPPGWEAELFRLLEEDVAPEFYNVGADGIPRDWVARVRRSLRTLGPMFGAGRMLEDYEKKVYKA